MPRARNIKVGFFKNEVLAECEPLARILFEALWCEADRDGRLEDRPKRLKAEYLAYDNVDIEDLLWQLADRGFIKRYAANGCNYIYIPNFGRHQKPHKQEESRNHPAFNGQVRNRFGSNSEVTPNKLGSDSESIGLIADCLLLNADGADSSLLNDEGLPMEVSAETAESGQSAASVPVVDFPVDGKNARTWWLIQSKLDEYIACYPSLDVPAQIRSARQWCIDHPTKRKTPGGMLGFLTRWLNRAQNSPRAGPPEFASAVRPSLDPGIFGGGNDQS